MQSRNRGSADFQGCCVAGFQTRRLHDCGHSADLEVGDTAGLETRATKAGGRSFEKSSQLVTILTDSTAENAEVRGENQIESLCASPRSLRLCVKGILSLVFVCGHKNHLISS
jgi:hypothetical protein